MMSFRTILLTFALFSLCGSVSADLIINLTQAGSGGVAISWSGSGQLSAGIGDTIELNDFSGNPFAAAVTANIDTDLRLDFGPSEETLNDFNLFDVFVLTDVGADTTDLQFRGDFLNSLTRGTFYSFQNPPGASPNLLAGLNYAALTPGTYSSTRADSSAFGSVTLNIAAAAVPEPATLAGCLLSLPGLWWANRRRKRTVLNGK